MNTVPIHGDRASSATFRGVTVDGTHNISEQFSLAYEDVHSVSFSSFRYNLFRPDVPPSGSFVQSSVDGTHKAASQTGSGWRSLALLIHEVDPVRVFGMWSTIAPSGSNFWIGLNGSIQVFLSSALNFVSGFIKKAGKLLPPFSPSISSITGLSFRSDFRANPSAVGTVQVFFSSLLNFSVASPKRSIPSTTSLLSFVTNFVRPRRKVLTAALAFVGVIRKSTFRGISGALSFLGSILIRPPHVIAQPLLQSTLSFSGAVSKGCSRTLMKGTLFFSSRIPRLLPRVIPSSLSFAGFWHPVRHLFTQSLTAILSFAGFIQTTRGLVFAAVMQFTGDFSRVISITRSSTLSTVGRFTGGILRLKFMQASLSFLGTLITRRALLFASSISFIANLPIRMGSHVFMVLSSAVRFAGVTTRAWTANLLLAGSVRFSGLSKRKFHSSLLLKSLTGSLGLAGSMVLETSFIRVILQSVLKFRASFKYPIDNLVALFNILITTIGQTISGTAREDHAPLKALNVEQTIGNTPTILDTSGQVSVLFVKNLDLLATVHVDSSSSFNKFPQLIVPGSGIYLSPGAETVFYAKSSLASSDIQIITASFRPNFSNPSSVLQLMGSLSTVKRSPSSDLYIQFDVNIHSSAVLFSGAEFIHVGLADGSDWVSIYSSPPGWWFYSSHGGNTFVTSTAPALDTWFTMGMHFDFSGPSVVVTPQLNGVDSASYDSATLAVIEQITIGAVTFSANPNNLELDNLTIGTTGFGSNDIFSANFDDLSIVPPFDSTTGTGLDASGGTLAVVNAGTNAWATKGIVFPP